MARRKSLLKDLMALSFRLPCRVAVGLAVVSFAALDMIASDAPAPIGGGASDDLGIVFVRQVFLSTAALLKVVVPLAFLAGAPGSFLRRSRGNALFDSAAADHAAAMQSMSWSEFEQLVEEAFRQRYAVSADTGRGPDGGADMILTNDTGRFLVQTWRWRQLGVPAIREHCGVTSAHGAAELPTPRWLDYDAHRTPRRLDRREILGLQAVDTFPRSHRSR
jgi:restriction system protein